MTAPTAADVRKARRAAFVGTVLEYYDFTLYGAVAATVFPQVFFPESTPLTGSLQSIATFAVAFLVRPIGGILLGTLGDRLGRRQVLTLTLTGMGAATLGIGLLPGHATLGWVAPVLLVVLRLLQGLAASGEYGGATLVAIEFTTSERRGLPGSLPGAGGALGGVLGTIALLVFSSTLSTEDYLSWGWRVPFLVSVVLLGYGLWLRFRLPETPSFVRTEQEGAVRRHPLLVLLREHPRAIAATLPLFLAVVGLGYFYLVFVVSYATTELGMTRSETLIGLLVAQLSCAVLTPVFGAFSDRIGRPALTASGLVLSIALAFPIFWLLQPGWPFGLWLVMFLGDGLAVAALFAGSGTLVADLLPTELRYTAMGFSREIGAMLGGGVVPLLAAQLIASGGGTLPISLMLVAIPGLALVGLALRPRFRPRSRVREAPDRKRPAADLPGGSR